MMIRKNWLFGKDNVQKNGVWKKEEQDVSKEKEGTDNLGNIIIINYYLKTIWQKKWALLRIGAQSGVENLFEYSKKMN